MTKGKAVELLKLELGTFDFALPQSWFDQMIDIMDNPLGNFVWYYEKGSAFGYPRPLTNIGQEALVKYNEKYGTSYCVTHNVIDV